jgi:hypothetical protein
VTLRIELGFEASVVALRKSKIMTLAEAPGRGSGSERGGPH